MHANIYNNHPYDNISHNMLNRVKRHIQLKNINALQEIAPKQFEIARKKSAIKPIIPPIS